MVRSRASHFLLALAACAVGQTASADIFMFKDDKGVVHFTNIPSNDKRFRLVRKEEGTSANTRAAGMPQFVMPREESIRRYSPLIETVSRNHGDRKSVV